MSTTYRVTHRTEYAYESEVSDSYGQVHLLPRELPTQRCSSTTIEVDPVPESYHERVDFFGNRAGFFAIHAPHRRLAVTATSIVEVDDRGDALSLFGHRPWEQVRDRVVSARGAAREEAVQFTLPSDKVAAALPKQM